MDNKDCLFCKIIKGEIPSYKIYEDKYTFAFLDISASPEGHTLVVPKNHTENVTTCSQLEFKRVMSAAKKIAGHYEKIGFADATNYYINSGKEAGQEVMHLHVHIMPRRINDGIIIDSSKNKSSIKLSETHELLKM